MTSGKDEPCASTVPISSPPPTAQTPPAQNKTLGVAVPPLCPTSPPHPPGLNEVAAQHPRVAPLGDPQLQVDLALHLLIGIYGHQAQPAVNTCRGVTGWAPHGALSDPQPPTVPRLTPWLSRDLLAAERDFANNVILPVRAETQRALRPPVGTCHPSGGPRCPHPLFPLPNGVFIQHVDGEAAEAMGQA